MKIELELDIEEAAELRDWLRKWHGGISFGFAAMILQTANTIDSAIQNESERRAEQDHERAMSEGGNPARERHISEYGAKYR